MNIHLYLREFPIDPGGPLSGPMKAVHGLASGLAACGANVTVLCEGPTECVRSSAGYTIRSFRNGHVDARFLISSRLKQFLRDQSEGSGLVILNGLFNPTLYSFARWLWRERIPYVAASQSSYHPAVFGKHPCLKWAYWYVCERQFLRRSQAIQVLDVRQSRWLSRLGIRRPTFQVPNGFESQEVPAESDLTWSADGKAKVIYFGRIDAYTKGLDLLVEAFGRLAGDSRVTFTIQGPNRGDQAQLEGQAHQERLDGRLSFVEPDFRRPPPAILSGHDIVCLPSRYEGFGLSALEAMLAGRVLLVSNTAGIAPHVIESGCGVVVEPHVDSIETGLKTLLQLQAKWPEMGMRGRHHALQHLRWESIAEEALPHYRALVRASGSSQSVPAQLHPWRETTPAARTLPVKVGDPAP